MHFNKEKYFKYNSFGLIWRSSGLEFRTIQVDLNTKHDINIENKKSINWPDLPKENLILNSLNCLKMNSINVNEIADLDL